MKPPVTSVRFFNPGLAYQRIKPEIDAEIQRVLAAGDLIMRKDCDDFELALAQYVGTKYAVGLNSGTDALYLSLWALGIKAGDEVLVPSHTFVATAQVVQQLGAKPVLYDMDNTVAPTDRTKAIIVAHIAGDIDIDMKVVEQIAKDFNIPIIEDACQALGAIQNGKMAGSFGATGCFSFYPAKILGAYGDAGAVVTDDFNLYWAIKELRNHCKTTYGEWGINSRLDNIQAAVLNVKMKGLRDNLLARQRVANMYDAALKGLPIILPRQRAGRVYQDYIILFNTQFERDNAFDALKTKGVETMKNEYPMPIPKMPLAQDYEARSLRIPCNDNLDDEDVDFVINAIKSLFAV